MLQPFQFDLTGRIALVTGASSGLGSRFASLLAAHGAKVALCARRKEPMQSLVDEITGNGGEAMAIALDATDEAQTIAAYDEVEERFGAVDTVFANAGISNAGSALKMPVEDFDAVMAINVRGAFLTAREGARRMIAAGSAETGRGRIVVTASLAATLTSPGFAAYGASKAAVAHMARNLALEWVGRGINVNSLCPGFIRTGINDEWFDSEAGKKQIAMMPRKRLIPEETLDPLVLFLASDASAAVTGSDFVIHDGQGL